QNQTNPGTQNQQGNDGKSKQKPEECHFYGKTGTGKIRVAPTPPTKRKRAKNQQPTTKTPEKPNVEYLSGQLTSNLRNMFNQIRNSVGCLTVGLMCICVGEKTVAQIMRNRFIQYISKLRA
ncbi:unnamed protein product, partial [Allacma fusca]